MTERKLRVDVVIPVYNEEQALPGSIAQLDAFLREHCRHDWRIDIADNASIDRTPEVGKALEAAYPSVHYERLEKKGRGLALRTAWLGSDADILSYMDVDLSTNLSAYVPMIESIATGGYEVAIGSRLKHGAQVTRQWKRELISRVYNLMIKVIFPLRRFSDAQCGFKAISGRAARRLIPIVENNHWFFDSELLLRAEQHGYRIFEVPVEWVEDLDTRVKIASTAWEDIKGLLRVRFTPKEGRSRA